MSELLSVPHGSNA